MVHLHTHSMYSLRDSIIRPEEIVQRLAEIGQSTIAITDHGNSLGGVSLYKTLKENGIKYIHGVEFYTCDDVKVKDKNNKYYHLVALCKNEQGRLNLNKLMSMSQHPDNFYSKPRIDFEMLSQYGEGLIIMSACLAGEVSKAFIAGEDESAKEIALRYQSRFGEDYYLEVQAHRDPEQIEVNRKILSLAQALNIQVVVTCDAHYTWEKDKQYQNKYAFNGSYKEDGEAYVDCFIQSEDEIRQRLSYLPQEIVETLISNTDVVAAKCNVEMPLSAPIMPEIKTPLEFTSNKQWLQQLCVQGFKEKLNIDLERRAIIDGSSLLLSQEEIDSYIQRYEYELNALDKMGFIDYILLVYSYSNVGHRRGIARGSGGGSLINYLTNITNIDPIEHKLYFERFIDVGALAQLESGEITPKELKIPDIDLDFSGESCDEVMRFLYETYGEERVASIGKFGTNQTKGTIRDMCKVLDISLESADKIAKAFENYELDEIDNMISGQLEISAGAKTAIQCVKDYPVLFDYVRKLNGLPKSFGLHACGKVISTRPLDDFLPSCYDSKGIRYLQGDMHDVEDVGLVKVDVLGLRTLDAEYDALEMAGEDLSFVNPKQDFKDPNVLRIFSEGDTLGIFQMASSGMKSTLKKMNVSGIEDLSVANALFRPGSLQYIDAYCNRKAGRESFEYLHPDLEPILENTFGIIVFQEQLIEIGRMAGLHNPDLLRKATGKKNPKLLAEIKPELESKLKARGWTQEQFDQLWSDMLEFAKYSFNKCVSGSTTLIKPATRKDYRNPSVEEMYKIVHDLQFAKDNNFLPLRSKYLRTGYYGTSLSMFEDGRVRKNKIIDIQEAGVRKVYRITTQSGKYIECTGNHKFPTADGEKQLLELDVGDSLYCLGEYQHIQHNYNFTDGNFESNVPKAGEFGFQKRPDGESVKFERYRNFNISNSNSCEICGKKYSATERFELHHKDKNRSNNDESNLVWCCASCHKKLDYQLGRTKTYENGLPVYEDSIVSIEYVRMEMTYDVTMADPAHNFVANNGLITCNSHSSAYAIIAYMTAKEKAYYPAEFYAGLCNSYIGESSFVKDNATEIVEDISRHNIRILPFDFRQDHRRCNVVDGKLVWAIPLIKDCNQQMAEVLYQVRDKTYTHFWRLAKELRESGLGEASIDILIKLGFFNEFGNCRELLRIMESVVYFKYGTRVSVKKAALQEGGYMWNIICQFATDTNDKGDELKTFRIIDCESILDCCEDFIKESGLDELETKILIQYQTEKLGFSGMATGKESDRRKLYIRGVYPLNRKSDGKQFGYSVIGRSIGSGKESRYTVFNRSFDKDPIQVGDMVYCEKYEVSRDKKDKSKVYYAMTQYHHII